MSSIKLQNLRKTFGPVEAVKSLDLEFANGEFAALLGPSGCGKSTTMNMISGLETPTSGDIYFGNTPVTHVPAGKRGVGFVFQNYAIFSHMSVFDNIAFGLKVRKLSGDDIKRKVQQVAELLELTGMLHHNAGRLSINDMQKVAIGRSMILEPQIFLLDEPFSNLDASFRFYMRGQLKRFQREIKQTMIYVTHDQVEAMSMADKIAVMDFGILQQFGTPDEIYNQPTNTFVANFIGSPSMNFMDCTFHQHNGAGLLTHHSGGRVSLDDKRSRLLEQNPDKSNAFILGIRPEYLHLHSQPAADSWWQTTVYMVEPLGSKTIVHLQLGTDIVQAIAPADFRAEPSTPQWLELPPDHIHIFGKSTEQAIR
ncbi:MAG: Maltose/maltodextrin import ATP-binding protein MalK [Anaerolineae bacterium]|nr:Maltose/maltodextrin import ATP-binding protein MalK [Anaerolineae bacterium]